MDAVYGPMVHLSRGHQYEITRRNNKPNAVLPLDIQVLSDSSLAVSLNGKVQNGGPYGLQILFPAVPPSAHSLTTTLVELTADIRSRSLHENQGGWRKARSGHPQGYRDGVLSFYTPSSGNAKPTS